MYTISHGAEAVPRFPDITWQSGTQENKRSSTNSRGVIADPLHEAALSGNVKANCQSLD